MRKNLMVPAIALVAVMVSGCELGDLTGVTTATSRLEVGVKNTGLHVVDFYTYTYEGKKHLARIGPDDAPMFYVDSKVLEEMFDSRKEALLVAKAVNLPEGCEGGEDTRTIHYPYDGGFDPVTWWLDLNITCPRSATITVSGMHVGGNVTVEIVTADEEVIATLSRGETYKILFAKDVLGVDQFTLYARPVNMDEYEECEVDLDQKTFHFPWEGDVGRTFDPDVTVDCPTDSTSS